MKHKKKTLLTLAGMITFGTLSAPTQLKKEKAGRQTNWQAGGWIIQKSVIPQLTTKRKRIEAGNP